MPKQQGKASKAKEGDVVKVHYTGKLKDKSIFDSSQDGDPLEITLGTGQVIPGFEKAVVGMDVGDSKTVEIAAQDAYGSYRDELVVEIDKETGVGPWFKPFTVEYDFTYAGVGKKGAY